MDSDLLSLTPKIVGKDVSSIAQRIEIEFVDASQQRRGTCQIQRMVRDAHVEANIDDMELEVRMAPSDQSEMMLKKCYMPRSGGSIILNGKVIGKYLSTREVVVMNPLRTKIRVVPDHFIRRFYWARQHGLSLPDALKYSAYRNIFLLVEGKTVLSSFCGHISTPTLLSHHDIREVEALQDDIYCCIFALCLLWNACCPEGGDPHGNPLRGRMGDEIPDIPSYSRIEVDGKKFLSLEPEDIGRKLTFADRMLCFVVYRLYFAIPVALCCLWLSLVIACQGPQGTWDELIFPGSVLCLLIAIYFIWVKSTKPKAVSRFIAD